MNAFRGVRYISSNVGVRLCRSQQQRRLVSLAFPAMTQKLVASTSFQNAIIAPVNKYDLSGGVGVLSSTCSALFSTATDAMSDETSSSVEESDSEAGIESRWPSPVHQHQQNQTTRTRNMVIHSNVNAVFVGGYNFNHREMSLREIFSQFGPVIEVSVPKMRLYNQTAVDSSTYRFAFVRFKDEASAKRALEANSITTDRGHLIEIKEKYKENKKELLAKRTIVVKNLPDDFTVQKCIHFFGEAGKLQVVNIVFNNLIQRPNEKSFVFLVYQHAPDMTRIKSILGSISDDVVLEDFKISSKQPPRNRSKKVFIEGVPTDLPMDALINHFKKFGGITYSKLFDLREEDTISSQRTAVIEYEENSSAMSSSEELQQIVDGATLTVRCLGWRKD